MSKIEINIDSTALGSAACLRNFYLTTVGKIENDTVLGGYKTIHSASMVYGIAVHKFIDVMYKTNGHYPTARVEAERLFALPKTIPEKQGYLGDPRHLITTCYNLWTSYIEEDSTFEVLQIPTVCYWCNGTGAKDDTTCAHCKGGKIVQGPATELTFRILIYETERYRIYLCGTIDTVGKFKNGCYAIRDWKTSSSWNTRDYMVQYELSRQLRIYTLSAKLMADLEPNSILGKIGATNMGSFIDAIFIKSKPNDNEYQRSDVLTYGKEEMEKFRASLERFCYKFTVAIDAGYVLEKEGILNGACEGKWGKCKFWNVCKNSDQVGELLLKRDFEQKLYNPLAFNE